MKSILNLKIFLIIILFSNTILSQSKLPNKAELEIETLFKKFVNNNSPGYAVGILIDTTLAFAKGFGNANLEYNIKITPETVFNLASLSKQFIAACLALLILEKKVSLEDNVKNYIPEFPDYNYEVKIKHLVYMTSGIPEYFDMLRGNGLSWNPYLYFTIDTAIQASLRNKKLEYEPGTKWSYSNINYMLMTKIIEKISGQAFSEFAKEHLFEPLGMKHTIVNDDITEIIPNRATGYVERSTKNLEAFEKAGMKLKNNSGFIQVHRNSPHYGGSGVYSTINDLYLWEKNMYTHKFGGEELYKLMHKRMKFKHPKDNDAFGLVYGEYNGAVTIWYSGSDLGFSTYFISFPKQKFTVICLSNLDDGKAESYAMKIIDILVDDGVIKFK